MRRGSLKCGGEHYLIEESGQRYRISRLENNRWTVLRRVAITVLEYLENFMNYYDAELLRSNSTR